MGQGECYQCIKYLMFAFNCLFWVLGCVILGIGIWLRFDPYTNYVYDTDDYEYLHTGAYILIVVGVFVVVIGFLGCCGAIRESQCMLATFFLFLFVIFSVLLAAGIWAIIHKDTLPDTVTTSLDKHVKNYNTSNSSMLVMDMLQKRLDCCGANNGANDYEDNAIPESCKSVNFGKPCSDVLLSHFSKNLVIVAGVGIGIGLIMFLGMLFAMMLFCSIRDATEV